jgi:D-sedoheptulose 7-phosphate isomerase
MKRAIADSFAHGGRVIAFGNGGSAAEADHLVAELLGRARRERDPLPAFALSSGPATITALGNDYGFAEVFARQVRACARRGCRHGHHHERRIGERRSRSCRGE